MARENRYDALRDRIRRQFTRTKTYTVELAADEAETVVFIDDPDFVGNDDFQVHGPYTHVRASVLDGEDVTAFTRSDRSANVSLADTAGQRNLILNDQTGQRYIGYVRLENNDSGAPATVELQVGTKVDSTELSLLKMSGLLDIKQ